MAFDDKTLKRDGSGITPVPQHFNPTADDYEPVYGRNNASRVELYGPDGNPISTDDSNKLAVRASEIETILNEIKSKDFATQTTAAAILAKLIAAPATEAKQDALAALIGEVDADPTANTLLARIKSLEDKIDKITNGTTPATTQLTGSKTQQLLTRAVRASGIHVFTILDLPVGCKGIHVMIRIYGVTGTFVSSEGLTLITRPFIAEGVMSNIQLFSPKITTATSYDQIWQKGGVKGDATFARAGCQIAGVVPGNRLSGELNITGTFTEGQGFDCEVWALCMV